MPTYTYCGFTIASDIIIPELSAVKHRRSTILFNVESARPQSPRPSWSHRWFAANGETLISYARRGRDHLLRFPALADFTISADGRRISCVPVPGLPEVTTRHLFLDQVMPRCLAHNGGVMLHASAVRTPRGMLLFVGRSQAGKSTLAGSFHQAGFPAASDDVVLVQESRRGIRAVPSYGGLRLWKDSLTFLNAQDLETRTMAHYSSKRRVPLVGQAVHSPGKAASIRAAILLASRQDRGPQEISLIRLPAREAYMELEKASFRLDIGSARTLSRHMRALGRIVSRLAVYLLSMPLDFRRLPAVRQAILGTVL